jgi:predicted GNAT family N-acyltransferase
MTTLDVLELAYPDRFDDCLAIRHEVFVGEQGVTEEEEFDGLDPSCLHFLAVVEGQAVGAARLRQPSPSMAKAERVAVLGSHRGLGVGQALMRALAEAARQRGAQEIVLGAQLTAIPFYESLGYRAEGEEYLDARIRHRMMRQQLSGPQGL